MSLQPAEDDFYTPDQTPNLSRASSRGNLNEDINNDEAVAPVHEQDDDAGTPISQDIKEVIEDIHDNEASPFNTNVIKETIEEVRNKTLK